MFHSECMYCIVNYASVRECIDCSYIYIYIYIQLYIYIYIYIAAIKATFGTFKLATM